MKKKIITGVAYFQRIGNLGHIMKGDACLNSFFDKTTGLSIAGSFLQAGHISKHEHSEIINQIMLSGLPDSVHVVLVEQGNMAEELDNSCVDEDGGCAVGYHQN